MESTLVAEHHLPALYMVWPRSAITVPLPTIVPDGYALGAYKDGDTQALSALFAQEGWNVDDAEWRDYMERVLPNGLFILSHTASNQVVGTAGAIHNPRGGRYYFPFGGALAYLVVHPEHRGRHLGTMLAALVVQRLRAAEYEQIWVGVQGFRLPAIKTYLKLGFVPFLHQAGLAERWQRICEQIGWLYTPDAWPSSLR
jgi:mycothiol synthase